MATADILSLFENSHSVHPANSDVDIAFTQSECHKYKISTSSDCAEVEGVQINTMYLSAQFRTPEKVLTRELEEKTDGTNKVIAMRIDYDISMELIIDDFLLFVLHSVGLQDTIEIAAINPAGTTYEIDPATWEVEHSSDSNADTYPATISFRLKETAQVKTACCPEDSIVTFEDPCDENGGEPPEDPTDPCEDFDVSLTFSDPTLSPDITGGPSGATTTYRWLYDSGNGVFTEISTAGSINVTNPGVYRLIATRGTCQASYDYEYFGECDDFEVTLTEPVDGVLVASANRIATFEWQKDTGSGYVTIGGETGPILIATEDADYKVIATYGDCEDEAELTVTLDVCAHSVEIARDGNTLETTVTGNTGTPTYQWYADYGDGMGTVLISGATDADYVATQPGCYEVKVTADGCDKYAKYLILDECVGFSVVIEQVEPDGMGGVDLTAMAVNPPGTVTYVWYQAIGGVWQSIGTGATLTGVSTTGNVRVEATSEGCTAEDMLFFCVDPGTLENYQAFIGDDSSLNWEVTVFTLPNPATLTENEINAMLQVYRNGVKLQYKDTPTDRTHYSIDFANNEIDLFTGWPLKSTEKLEVLKLT